MEQSKAKVEGETEAQRIRAALGRAGLDEARIVRALKSAHGCPADQKCGMCDEYVLEWRPFGGATTFSDYDEWRLARERQYALDDLTYTFDSLVQNIMSDDDMEITAKAQAIMALATELEARVEPTVDDAGEKAKKKGGIISAVLQSLGLSRADVSGLPDDGSAEAAGDSGVRSASAPGMITIFRDKADPSRYRYVAVASNRFEDKEGEIFAAKAHEEYVDWVNRTGNFPELWLWHVPHSRIGQADAMAYDDAGFRVSSGLIDADKGFAAEALMREDGPLAMSHGYVYLQEELVGGVYGRYRTFEETVLPKPVYAANDATSFTLMEEAMSLKGEQRDFFVRVLGEDATTKIEQLNGERSKSLIEAGVAFKAMFDATIADAEGAKDAPPADPAPVPAAAPADAKDGADAPPADAPEAAPAATEPAPGPASDMTAMLGQIGAMLKPIADTLEDIKEWRTKVDERLEAAQKTPEEMLADIIRPRTPLASAGASRDEKTVASGTAAEAAAKLIEDALEVPDDLDAQAKSAMPYAAMLLNTAARPGMASVVGSPRSADDIAGRS